MDRLRSYANEEASDGKHVWVRRYEQLGDRRTIATEITNGVASTIP